MSNARALNNGRTVGLVYDQRVMPFVGSWRSQGEYRIVLGLLVACRSVASEFDIAGHLGLEFCWVVHVLLTETSLLGRLHRGSEENSSTRARTRFQRTDLVNHTFSSALHQC